MDEQVSEEEYMFDTSIHQVAVDVGLETEGLEDAYSERVRELADSIDLERLGQRMADDPYIDRDGPTPDHVERRREAQIYQNVLDARSD